MAAWRLADSHNLKIGSYSDDGCQTTKELVIARAGAVV